MRPCSPLFRESVTERALSGKQQQQCESADDSAVLGICLDSFDAPVSISMSPRFVCDMWRYINAFLLIDALPGPAIVWQ